MNTTERKRTFSYNCSLIIIYLLALSSIFSPIRALQNFNSIWAIGVVSWVAFSILDNPSYFLKPDIYRILVYIYIIYTISFAYLMGNGVIGNRFFELSQLPMFYLAYQKNTLNGFSRDNRRIILLIVPFVLVSILLTIAAYKINPLISRDVKAGTEMGIDYMKRGIGGYELIYFLTIIFPVLIYLGFNRPPLMKRKYRIAIILMVILTAINVALSNFSTASFLIIICVIYRLIVPRLNKRLFVLFLIGLGVLIIFSSQILYGLLDLMGTIFGNTVNAEHVGEIQNLISKNQMGDSLSARIFTYNDSINAFFKNPLFGILTKPLNSSGKFLVGFGQHSQILDAFALYGIGIGILQLYIYFQPIISRININDWTLSSLAILMSIIFFTLVLINNATPSVGFAVFFIFPTVYDWIQERRFVNTI